MTPTENQLAQFLRKVRQRERPATPLPCGRASSCFNSRSCSPEQASELAELADRPPPGLSLYKFGSRSVVGSFVLTDGSAVVLKYYYPKNLSKHLSHGITGSRCLGSWTAALAFQYLELPTPEPLVIAEWHKLGGWWLEKAFLATRQAEGVTLDDWVRAVADDRDRLDAMAAQLQRLFSRMAELRIAHGDLKASNLIVGSDDTVTMIDLDACEVLLSPATWSSHRERDRRIFESNWQGHPAAAAAFAHSFEPAIGS